MFEFLLSYFGNKQRLFNYFLPIPYRFTEDYQSIGGQFENIWRVNKNFLMFGSMTVLLTLINWGRIILLMLSPTFKLIDARYIYICLVLYLIFMRPKSVSRDQRLSKQISANLLEREFAAWQLASAQLPRAGEEKYESWKYTDKRQVLTFPRLRRQSVYFHSTCLMFDVTASDRAWQLTSPGAACVCLDHGAYHPRSLENSNVQRRLESRSKADGPL